MGEALMPLSDSSSTTVTKEGPKLQYPIAYAYPAKTFTLIFVSCACTGLGLIGVLANLASVFLPDAELQLGPLAVSFCLLAYGSDLIRRMANPDRIELTETELHLPKTIIGGPARAVPYEEIRGVSLYLNKVHRTATIFTQGRKFTFSTHVVGFEKFFELIEEIHEHANLGPPPIGTLRGVYRAVFNQS